MIHRVPLQPADGDGLFVVAQHHAGALAQHVHRTDARTTCAQNVCVQDGQRRAHQVLRGDFLDEARHIDVRGTGRRAGRIEAVEAAVGFDQRFLRSEGGMQIRKPAGDLRVVLESKRNRGAHPLGLPNRWPPRPIAGNVPTGHEETHSGGWPRINTDERGLKTKQLGFVLIRFQRRFRTVRRRVH